MQPIIPLAASALSLSLAATAFAQDQPPDGAVMARMATTDGADIGTVTLRETRAGVLVEVDLAGLPPGKRAIHIHETGACTPDFAAAGEHLAPDGHEHGFIATEQPHAGDLPNLIVAADGTARAEFVNWRLSFEELLDDDSSAVVVHEQEDSYADPTSAGARIACGVVEQVS